MTNINSSIYSSAKSNISNSSNSSNSSRRNNDKSSILHKIFIYTSILSLLIMCALMTVLIKSNRKEIQNNLNSKTNTLIKLLSQTAIAPIWNFELQSLKNIAEMVFTDEDLTSIKFSDDSGKILAANDKSEKNINQNQSTTFNSIFYTKKDILFEGKIIGNVMIGMSTDRMDKQMYIQTIMIMAIVIILQILLSATIYLTVKKSLFPIDKQIKILDEMLIVARKTAKNLQLTGENIKKGAFAQLSAVNDWFSSTNSVLKTSNDTSQYANNSLDIAKSINDMSQDGKTIMNEVSATMDDIMKVGEKLQNISKMNTSEILKKTEIINNIVFETKILSFNASIEAANAGQYGSGFAVVAGELVKLATISGQAANEIDSTNQANVNEITEVLTQAMISFKKGQLVASNALKLFDKISNTIQEIQNSTNLVLSNSKKVSDSTNYLITQIKEIKNLAQKNTNSALELNNDSANVQNMNSSIHNFISSLSIFIFGHKKSS
ncbi:MAG: hypothetical protein HQK49_07630 [Oligoflexia bacterium]|nr:hypothetical protein [Oligoflexia bacterium]